MLCSTKKAPLYERGTGSLPNSQIPDYSISPLLYFLRCRQQDLEDRELPFSGLHADQTLVIADDRVAHRKSQTPAGLLGREIGVEDFREILLGDPLATISD